MPSEIEGFFRKTAEAIVALTVTDILEEQTAYRVV